MTAQTRSRLTFPQRKALGGLMFAAGPREARQLFVRSDVLWRLEARGLVRQNIHGQWSIRQEGRQAYQEAMDQITGEMN